MSIIVEMINAVVYTFWKFVLTCGLYFLKICSHLSNRRWFMLFRTVIFSISVFILFSPFSSSDDTLSITPGKYLIVSTEKTNLLPSPKLCSAANLIKKGNKITYDVTCKGDRSMPAMSGNVEFSSTGTMFTYDLKMNGSIEGTEYNVHNHGEGERLGECSN